VAEHGRLGHVECGAQLSGALRKRATWARALHREPSTPSCVRTAPLEPQPWSNTASKRHAGRAWRRFSRPHLAALRVIPQLLAPPPHRPRCLTCPRSACTTPGHCPDPLAARLCAQVLRAATSSALAFSKISLHVLLHFSCAEKRRTGGGKCGQSPPGRYGRCRRMTEQSAVGAPQGKSRRPGPIG